MFKYTFVSEATGSSFTSLEQGVYRGGTDLFVGTTVQIMEESQCDNNIKKIDCNADFFLRENHLRCYLWPKFTPSALFIVNVGI